MLKRKTITFITMSSLMLLGCQQKSNTFLGKWQSMTKPKITFIIYRLGPQSPHFPMETEANFILEYTDNGKKPLNLQYFPLKQVMLGISEEDSIFKLELSGKKLTVDSYRSEAFGSSRSFERAD